MGGDKKVIKEQPPERNLSAAVRRLLQIANVLKAELYAGQRRCPLPMTYPLAIFRSWAAA